MVEPTESEDKEELDRFCDALIGTANKSLNIFIRIYSLMGKPSKTYYILGLSYIM